MPHSPFIDDRLERLSRDLHSLRFRCGKPARTASEVERRVAEGERIAAALRAAFRG